jgi:DNA-binding response OmpR family regulator
MNDHTTNILVVEDEPQIRRYLGAALLSEGFNRHSAANLGINYLIESTE